MELWRCSAPALQLRAGLRVKTLQGQTHHPRAEHPHWAELSVVFSAMFPAPAHALCPWPDEELGQSQRVTLDPSHPGLVINHIPIKLPRQHILEGHPE